MSAVDTKRGWAPLITFVVIAYGISWLIWMPLWLPAFGIRDLPVLPFHHALGAFGPLLAALIVNARTGGRRAVADLIRRIMLPGPRWWLTAAALLGPLMLLGVGLFGAKLIGGVPIDLASFGRSSEFPGISALGFLAYNILTFGIGEETGWRGFALPQLQSRFSALAATAILTVVWAGWHLPLFAYRPGYTGMDIGGIAGWLASLATGAVLTTALFNASRGSIMAAALFHAAVDVAFTSQGLSPLAINICGAAITLAGIATVLVFRPANLWTEGRMIWTEAGLSMREPPAPPRPSLP